MWNVIIQNLKNIKSQTHRFLKTLKKKLWYSGKNKIITPSNLMKCHEDRVIKVIKYNGFYLKQST